MKRHIFLFVLFTVLACGSLSSCCGRGCLVQSSPPADASPTASAETVKRAGS